MIEATARTDQQTIWTKLKADQPILTYGALVMLGLTIPTIVAYNIDLRTIDGVNPWVKPLKFELSIFSYLITLALFAAWLPRESQTDPKVQRFTKIAVICAYLEIIWIGAAAALGVKSHFNFSNLFAHGIYLTAGAVAVVLTTLTFVLGRAYRKLQHAELGEVFQQSIIIGLFMTFVTTIFFAGFLAQGTGAYVGPNPGEYAKLPILGWATDGGDLRVPHFWATHAIQVIPLIGLALDRLVPKPSAKALLIAASCAYFGFMVFTFVQALCGQPFIAMAS